MAYIAVPRESQIQRGKEDGLN
ncbi:uncharacterized protein G2W53_036452 [Senna tora]|uniref:Uncharacterized protein n=1 Tax=Senna tora TaxID=362788 RepID=A0A834STI8_9FABA|nr:uncharacterized protein G2W53_036452 [Senna tora]